MKLLERKQFLKIPSTGLDYGSHLSTCSSSISEKEHQTELQTDGQHQFKTKKTRDALVIAMNQFAGRA